MKNSQPNPDSRHPALHESSNSVTISNMNGRRFGMSQRGELNVLLIPLVLAAVILIAVMVFAGWAYSSRQDYRNNSDTKVAAAVKVAKQEESISKDKEHAEADKQPLQAYKGQEQYGGVQIMFPKTWSAYVIDTSNASQPINGYFQPGIVPNVADKSIAFALRVQVLSQSYSSVVSDMSNLVSSKKVTAAPYAFPKVPGTVGVRFDGAIISNQTNIGSMVIVPIRDKTLKVWTESPIYLPDFNTYVLPNVTFSP